MGNIFLSNCLGRLLNIRNAFSLKGMVLFIPEGDDEDYTRQKIFYDGTYSLLKDIGIEEIQ